jgi:hypothetical protein
VKKPPKHAPRRITSTSDLRKFQRMMATAVLRPLTDDDNLQPKWIDGRSMEKVAAEFIKPNDRLTSFERLQLYNRMYWYRLFDAIRDDCPGLLSVLGDRGFWRLSQAYLAKCPSQSFTLRNLSSRLADFIRDNPKLTAPRTALAIEVARFEWAQTVAFDGAAHDVVPVSYFAGTPPSRIRLGIQPYVTLLELQHPVDKYILRMKKRDSLRSEASNTLAKPTAGVKVRRLPLPKKGLTHVAVHRLEGQLFYKRLDPAAYRVLFALSKGQTLARAIAAAGPGATPGRMRGWFKVWMALGWFCAYRNKSTPRAS